MRKGNFIILGIILISIVLIGSVFWYANNKQSEITMHSNKQEMINQNNETLIKVFKDDDNEINSEKINTSNWKTYRNNYYGYQVSYPGDWEIYINDQREQGTKSVDAIMLYITKNCDLQQLKRDKTTCANEIIISTHKPTVMPCAPFENKTQNGKLPVTISEAFHNIFSLNKNENRKSLQYNKESACFIYDSIPQCSYSFISDPIYFNEESCYLIDIKDSTGDRKYLKTEKAILETFRFIRK